MTKIMADKIQDMKSKFIDVSNIVGDSTDIIKRIIEVLSIIQKDIENINIEIEKLKLKGGII